MNPLPLVLADVRRAWPAVLAVVAVIAASTAMAVGITVTERALRRGSTEAAAPFDLLVGARGSPTQLVLTSVYLQPALLELLPGEILQRLQTEPGAVWTAPLVFGDSYRGIPIIGSSPELVTLGGRRPLSEGRTFMAQREVVVGASVPLQIGEAFEPAHGLPAGSFPSDRERLHEGFRYVVVGRLPPLGTPWDRAVIAPVEALWALHSRPGAHPEGLERIGPPWTGPRVPGVSAVVVKPRSVADAYRLRARYRTGDSQAVFPAEVLVDLYATLGDARNLLRVVAGVTQGLVLVLILLVSFAVVAQRRRQLGVLRALGASRSYVFAAVAIHVFGMLASGVGLGLLLGWLGAEGVARSVQARAGLALPVALAAPELRLVAWMLLGAGAVAVVLAWRAYRFPVSAALKG
jgi:putative ABC transport system permease protein